MRQIGHFIDGTFVPGTSGRTKDIFNPNTGEVQAQVNMATRRCNQRPKRKSLG